MSTRTRFARPAAVLALALATLSPLLMPPAPSRAQAAPGVKVSVLHKAYYPSTLTVGPDGSFFGTDGIHQGEIFKLTLGGLIHKLITFNTTNGAIPIDGPLLLLPDGSFFGSTLYGGKSGTGVLFQFTPTRRYQVKHEFAALNNNDSVETNVRGANPQQPMVLASDGAIYGTTLRGGITGGGVIFRYTAAKGVEVVYNFANGSFASGLTLGPDGALYGTTHYYSPNGIGQVFRCTTTGGFSILHTFSYADGYYPNGVPVVGPDGALYGTNFYGGSDTGNGTAYRITTDGGFTVLHDFDRSDLSSPLGPLVVGPDGKFYGLSDGKVYRMTAGGIVSVLYRTPATPNTITENGVAPVFGRDNRLYVSNLDSILKITVPF